MQERVTGFGRWFGVGLGILLAACDDGSGGGRVGPPCAGAQGGDGPQLPLTARRGESLILPLGTTADDIAFDYRVDVPFRVAEARVTWSFDPTSSPEPIPLTFDDACPATWSLESAGVDLPEAGVFLATVTTRDEAGRDLREGRLSFARGTRSIVLSLPAGAPTEGDAWALFEPAAGVPRVALARVSWGAEVRLDGLPAEAGEIAVFETTDLIDFPERQAVYARSGFEEAWRFEASSWYGAVLEDGEATRAQLLEIRGSGATGGVPPTLTPETAVDLADLPTLRASLERETEATLTVPCDGTLRVTVLGFGELRTGDLVVGPGGTSPLPTACDAGKDLVRVPIEVTSFNQRPLTLRLDGEAP